MNIQDLGSLGELIGGIAVVASVIYLTVQIRHGITGYQSNTILQTTHHFSNLQMETAKSDLMLEAWSKAESCKALTALEQRRIINIISSYLIGIENMFSQCKHRMMDKESYDARRIIFASFMGYTGIWEWWVTMGRVQFPEDFAADVEKSVQDFNIKLPELTGELFSE